MKAFLNLFDQFTFFMTRYFKQQEMLLEVLPLYSVIVDHLKCILLLSKFLKSPCPNIYLLIEYELVLEQ